MMSQITMETVKGPIRSLLSPVYRMYYIICMTSLHMHSSFIQSWSYLSMAAISSPKRAESQVRAWEIKQRLQKCWDHQVDWNLYPKHMKEVHLHY